MENLGHPGPGEALEAGDGRLVGRLAGPYHLVSVPNPYRYVPMRRRIPTAHVAVARTAPTIHRMRLGSRSASAIRPHAAARSNAYTCDQDARTRDPDTRATRKWICLCGRSWCAARAHRPGWARRALDARPSTPQPPGGTRRRRTTGSSVLATRHPTWRTRHLAACPSRLAARTSSGERRLAVRPPPRSRCARSRRR